MAGPKSKKIRALLWTIIAVSALVLINSVWHHFTREPLSAIKAPEVRAVR